VSTDSLSKQAKFAKNHQLQFPLLADVDHAIAEAYGVWKEKSFMGRKFMGVDRVTFLIDKNGILRQTFTKIDLGKHASQVAEAVREIG